MKKNAIVVGMPRSGTSLTARVFASAGYFAAEEDSEELRQGDAFNPDGYFEAEALVEANARVLRRAGLDAHNTWLFSAADDRLVDSIEALERLDEDRELVARYDDHAPWIWKDPRLCYTLGYWWPLLDATTSCVVLTNRDKDDIWQSFVRLGWRDESSENRVDVYNRVEDHISAAEKNIDFHSIPHIRIDYSDYRADPDDVASKIGTAFGLNLGVDDLGFRRELNHSSFRGSIERHFEKLVGAMPDSLRKTAKRITPKSIVGLLFPSRKP